MVRALGLARRFAEQAKVPAGVADQLAIVVEEWLLNAIEHGDAPEGSRLGLILERRPDAVRISATDAGVAFDPRHVEFKGPDIYRGGGAGLALIHGWTNFESYRRVKGRNRVVISLPI